MTDWNLIRKVTNAAIDACESVEKAGVTEDNRGDFFVDEAGKQSCTLWEYLQSAWTYPENLSYSIVRARHQLKNDKPYTNELGRTLMNIGQLCAELVGAEHLQSRVSGADPFSSAESSIAEMVEKLANWYQEHFSVGIGKIMKQKK